jgi:DNA-binding NtrC family response regulator
MQSIGDEAAMVTEGKNKTTIVLVMAGRDPVLEAIERQLEVLDVPRHRATSLQEFQQLSQESDTPDVVITGVSLPDGNWCDVLRSTVRDGASTRVLVCAREADERLWSEAIWRGVHDILVEPIAADHLRRAFEAGGFPPPGGNAKGASSSHGKSREQNDTYRSMPADFLTAVA